MMKRLLSVVMLSFLTLMTFAAKEDTYVLYANFDDGKIPSGWTQEYVSGQTAWVVETAAMQYPATTAAGAGRVLLRNNTDQTLRFKTRLISKVFDLKGVTLPVLMFSHSQWQRSGDVDTLRVYYRSAENSRWVELATYPDGVNAKYTAWTDEYINLPAQSETYQIMFEGSDNFGHGIALDEIIVRPEPTCNVPSNLTTGELTTNSARLSWLASLDADSIELVLATEELDLENVNESAIVLHTFTKDFSYNLSELTRNKTYYWYVNSHCSGQESGWAGSSFRTKNLATVPYIQQFNLNYAANTLNHMAYMTQGTSIRKDDGSMEYMPFVNQNTTDDGCKSYSFDSTRCYVFTGARAVTTRIPAGEYVYGATPEMNVEDIRDLSVTFWGTAERYVGLYSNVDYAAGIIVGIMTNPEDFGTFVAVDTCYITEQYSFNRFTVNFNKYAGYKNDNGDIVYGKYVAFASNFKEKDNIFYVDDITVDYTPEVQIPVIQSISAVDYNKFTVTVNNLEGADSWNLVIASDFKFNGTKPAQILVEKTGITGSTFTVEADAITNKLVQVYAQAVKGSVESAYSLPIVKKVPGVRDTLPYEITFNGKLYETYDYRVLYNYGRSTTSRLSIPWDLNYSAVLDNGNVARTPWYYSSAPGIVMTYVGEYIALPAINNLKDTYIRFSFSPYYSSEGYVDDARLAIGVMTDPYDLSTFDSLAVFDGTGVLTPRQKVITYAFDTYEGSGKYIALKYVMPKSGKDGNGVNVYYTNVYEQGECPLASQVKIDASATEVNLSWVGVDTLTYLARLYSVKAKSTAIDKALLDTMVTGTTVTIGGLNAYTNYYYNIATVCGNDTVWGSEELFTTECYPKQPLPYFEGFETYATGANTKRKPDCWNISGWSSYAPPSGGSGSISYYPYFGTAINDSYVHGGSQYMNIGASMTSSTNQWLSLPVMAAPVDSLQLSFWLKSPLNGYNDTIEIGLLPADATDFADFEPITYFVTPATSDAYHEYILRLDSYTGNSENKRITFLKRSTKQHYWYLDDVKVDYLSDCAKISDIDITNIGTAGATFNWASPTATEWQILVAKKSLTEEQLAAIDVTAIDSTVILAAENVASIPYNFVSEVAEINTTYYLYVRGNCEGTYGDWSNEVTFATMCASEEIATYSEDFSLAANASCWTMGVRSGTTNAPSFYATGNYLYIFNTTASDGAYAITPPLASDDISKWQISFDAHGGTSAAYLKEVTVGIITNASDLSTFEPMMTVKLNQVSVTTVATNYGFDEAYRYTVRFDQYEGDWRGNIGNRIMFISESGEVANYVYIDNISFDTISAPREPLDVQAVEVGMDYAVLTWDKVGTKYEVKVSSTKIDPATQDADKFSQIVEADSVRVSGLNMLTKYYVYVRNVEGEAVSAWSNVRWFSTQCPVAYELPYFDDFTGKVARTSSPYDAPDCWNMYYDGATGSTYSRLYATANRAGTVTADNGLYMGSTFGSATSTPKSSVAVSPAINADFSKAMLEFDWRSSATSITATAPAIRYLAYGVSEYAEPYDSVMSTLQIIDTLNTGDLFGPDGWLHAQLMLNNYTGSGKHIVLINCKGNSYSATSQGYIYVDNVSVVEAPAVFTPASIECSKTFGSTAELSWTQTLGNYSEWQVVAVPAGQEIPANPEVQTFNDTKGTFTGLQGATEYEFYVRAVDNGQVSDWVSYPAKGITLYLVEVADAFWNFDDKDEIVQYGTTSTYIMQKGWLQGMTKGSYTQSNVPYLQKNTINSTSKLRTGWYSFSGDTCLRFYSTATVGSYTVMPQINCNLDSMQLRFKARPGYGNEDGMKYSNLYAKGTYSRSITIGYMTDPYDYSTFKEITTYKADEVTATLLGDDPEGTNFWREIVVPLYGVGEGKYIAFSVGYDQTNYMYIDDVIVEKETGCAVPVQVTVADLQDKQATITWGSPKSSWNVKVVDAEDNVIAEKNNLTETTFTLENLTEQTNYVFSVQANCDGDEKSDWVNVPFKTPCTPTSVEGAYWGFVDNLYQYGSSATYLIPECTTVGGNTTTQSNLPYAITNAAATTYGVCYSRGDTVGGKAMQFYTTASYYDAYWTLPELDFELDSMTLHFWGRAVRFNSRRGSNATYVNRISAVNSGYLRKLVVGVMTDVTDLSTFTPLDTITYDKVWSGTIGSSMADRFLSDDKTGNDWWQEYVIPLAKYAGKGHITFLAPKPTAASYFYIDDVEIVKGSFCTAASNVRVTDLTSRTVTIDWDVAEDTSDSVAVALYLAINGKQPTDSLVQQVNALLPSHSYTFEGLMPGRDYYYAVKHICGDDEESTWSNPKMFTANYEAPFFKEDFEDVRTYPVDWSRGGGTSLSTTSNTVESVFNGGTIGSLTESATSSAAWRRQPGDGGMGNGTIYSQLATGTTSYTGYVFAWLFTPTISIMAEDSVLLSFDLGMWDKTKTAAPAQVGDRDQFLILASTDNGATWKEEDIVASWRADGTGTYDLNLVQNERKTWYVDVSKYVNSYANKGVKFAFYMDSRLSGTGNYIYLDNVQINTYSKNQYASEVCRWEDYADDIFTFDAYDLTVGTTVYEHFVPADKAGVNDQLTVLSLTVNTDTTTYAERTVCEGTEFDELGFHIDSVGVSDTYKRKLIGANGCDSTSVLILHVIPTQRTDIEATICQGSYYEFKGVRYYTSTIVTETFEATTGCDSIVTLHLTVNDILRGEEETVYLCPGDTYNFTEKYPALTEDGVYVDTVQTALGCDSVTSVRIVNVPSAQTRINALICEGESYNIYPFQGLRDQGDFDSHLETSYGCDSVVTLHLLISNGENIEEHLTTDDLPYILNGVKMLDVNTEEGTYVRTLNLGCGLTTVIFTVGEPSALKTTFVNSLAVAPNPVKAGESVKVLSSFTAQQMQNLVVEVFDATGMLISRQQPTAEPIYVEPLPTAGVYMIRVIANGEIYQTKVVAQ